MKKAMPKLNVNEIFYSLQGEGARAGQPSIFIRLKGCNLACKFCDTDFSDGKELTLKQIFFQIKKFHCKWIIWTGGEPSMQLNSDVIDFFKKYGYKQAIETNGLLSIPENIDWITLSPKTSEKLLIRNFKNGVTELKYVWNKNKKGIPKPKIKAEYYFLQPESDGNTINYDNLEYCINLCKKYPEWRLSTQLQKIWNIK